MHTVSLTTSFVWDQPNVFLHSHRRIVTERKIITSNKSLDRRWITLAVFWNLLLHRWRTHVHVGMVFNFVVPRRRSLLGNFVGTNCCHVFRDNVKPPVLMLRSWRATWIVRYSATILVRSGTALARQRIAVHRFIYVYVEQRDKGSSRRQTSANKGSTART